MSAEGGTHVIRVRLADLPACATDCFFAISAYNCRNLSLFRSLNVRLLDAESPTLPLAKLAIRDVPSSASCVVVCALRRRLEEWSVLSLGRACDATVRDYVPIEATIAPLQESHVRWRNRRPLMLLANLCQSGRAHPRVDSAISAAAKMEAVVAGGSSDMSDDDDEHSPRGPQAKRRRRLASGDSSKDRDVIISLLKLPTILFQCIVQYI